MRDERVFTNECKTHNSEINEGDLKQRNQPDKVGAVIICLAELVEEKDKVEEIRQRFSQYVTTSETGETGDLPKSIQLFLKEVVTEDTKVVKILKACNQSIIAPFVLQLRLSLCAEMPFKDGGFWLCDYSLQRRVEDEDRV